MQFPWRRNGMAASEQSEEVPTTPPAERTSAEWRAEIRELKAELDRIAEERASLTGSAGAALLDGQGARVTDIQGRLAELSTTEAIVQAAIAAARGPSAAASRREARQALDETERAYYALLARYCESQATIRDAEEHLARVRAEQRGSVDQLQISSLYAELLRAGRTPEAAEEPEVRKRNADGYRKDAARYRARAGIVPERVATVEEVEVPA